MILPRARLPTWAPVNKRFHSNGTHMRIIPQILLLLLAIVLAGCSTAGANHEQSPHPRPQLMIYHIKPGSEEAARNLIEQLWHTYQREGMVFPEPHVRIQAHEDRNHDRILEVFTWRSDFAIEHPPKSVEELWSRIKSLCEERNGNRPVEFRDVQMLVPKLTDTAAGDSHTP